MYYKKEAINNNNIEVKKMKKLYATNNPDKYALIDDDIFEMIQKMGLKFCINNYGYFQSTVKVKLPGMNKKKYLLLHRFVWFLKTGIEPTSEIDHIDRDPGNNQFFNLRLASRQQQNQNQGKRKNNTSGYIGVSHYHMNKKRKNGGNHYWLTQIRSPDGHYEAKYFSFTEAGKIAAAKYYDAKAIEYHGEFAVLNFPMPSDKQ